MLLFIAPAVILLAIFRIVPIFYGIYLSFTSWSGLGAPRFSGPDNYIRMLTDPTLHQAVLNNLVIACAIPVWVAFPLLIAVLIHEGGRYSGVLKVAFVVPNLVSPALLGLCFSLLLGLDGPINIGLVTLGLHPIEWLANSSTVLWSVVGILIYSSFGVGVLFYSAGLASIDASLTEAAAIDGANWFQRLWYVTIPHLRSVTLFWTVVVLTAATTATFPLIYTLTGGGPGRATTTIDVYIFQLAFQFQKPAYATAIGLVTFVVVFAVILTLFGLSRRRNAQ
ncbi:sugar ABC transporter permease [soil metagenome]